MFARNKDVSPHSPLRNVYLPCRGIRDTPSCRGQIQIRLYCCTPHHAGSVLVPQAATPGFSPHRRSRATRENLLSAHQQSCILPTLLHGRYIFVGGLNAEDLFLLQAHVAVSSGRRVECCNGGRVGSWGLFEGQAPQAPPRAGGAAVLSRPHGPQVCEQQRHIYIAPVNKHVPHIL